MKKLVSKVLEFCQLYEREKSVAILTDCHNVPEYISIVKALNDITLKDLGLPEKKLEEYFQGDTMLACQIVESSSLAIGFYIMPAGT